MITEIRKNGNDFYEFSIILMRSVILIWDFLNYYNNFFSISDKNGYYEMGANNGGAQKSCKNSKQISCKGGKK